jgi:hypothetical protein
MTGDMDTLHRRLRESIARIDAMLAEAEAVLAEIRALSSPR